MGQRGERRRAHRPYESRGHLGGLATEYKGGVWEEEEAEKDIEAREIVGGVRKV